MHDFSTVGALSKKPLEYYTAGLTIDGIAERPEFYCEYYVENGAVRFMFDENLPEALRPLKDRLLEAGAVYVYMANPKLVEPHDAIVFSVNFATGTQSERNAQLASILSEFTGRTITVE